MCLVGRYSVFVYHQADREYTLKRDAIRAKPVIQRAEGEVIYSPIGADDIRRTIVR